MSFQKYLMMVGLLGASLSYGAGFTILEQSAAGIGRSLAGMTVDDHDPASMYFNPSMPAWFDKMELSIGSHMMHVDAQYLDKGSSPELGTDESGNGGGWVAIPNMYFVRPLSSTVSYGMGMSATSGTRTDYNPHWIGRYTATETEISVMDLTPTLAWKIRDDLAIGIGLVLEYADVTMSQMLKVGPYGDSQMKVTGDSIAAGVAAGISYNPPIEGMKLGLGFRSRMTHDLDLKARVRANETQRAVLNATTGGALKSDGKAELNLPSMINFGVSQDINEKWRVMLDISWSEWSVMDELTLKYDRRLLGQRSTTQEMKWDDNWRFALGTDYRLTPKVVLRFGVAMDETPVQDDYRNTKLPDSNRYWVSTGLGYKVNEHVRMDFGYVHLFFPTVPLEQVDPNGYTVKGKERGVVDILSLSMTYTF